MTKELVLFFMKMYDSFHRKLFSFHNLWRHHSALFNSLPMIKWSCWKDGRNAVAVIYSS